MTDLIENENITYNVLVEGKAVFNAVDKTAAGIYVATKLDESARESVRIVPVTSDGQMLLFG